MKSFLEKHSKFIKKLIVIALLLLSIYIIISYLVPFFAPFLIALVISLINEPVVRFLENRLHINRRIGAAIAFFATLLLVGTPLILAVNKLYREAVDLTNAIREYLKTSNNDIVLFFQQAQDFYHNLNPEIIKAVQESINALAASIGGILHSLFNYGRTTINSIPKILIATVVTLISSYFFSSDKDKILSFIYKQLPPGSARRLNNVKVDILTAFAGYIRALLIIMAITFTVLAVGLSIIGIRYAFVIALLIALVDILPVLGTGTVLIPWMIWSLVAGQLGLALSLLILYCTVILIRQIFEPKIVGTQIGLHPIVTLLAMYTGLNLFGIFGMILGPIIILVLKNLQQAGVINLWNE